MPPKLRSGCKYKDLPQEGSMGPTQSRQKFPLDNRAAARLSLRDKLLEIREEVLSPKVPRVGPGRSDIFGSQSNTPSPVGASLGRRVSLQPQLKIVWVSARGNGRDNGGGWSGQDKDGDASEQVQEHGKDTMMAADRSARRLSMQPSKAAVPIFEGTPSLRSAAKAVMFSKRLAAASDPPLGGLRRSVSVEMAPTSAMAPMAASSEFPTTSQSMRLRSKKLGDSPAPLGGLRRSVSVEMAPTSRMAPMAASSEFPTTSDSMRLRPYQSGIHRVARKPSNATALQAKSLRGALNPPTRRGSTQLGEDEASNGHVPLTPKQIAETVDQILLGSFVTAARLPRLPCNETPSEIGNSERGADNLSAGAHNMRVPTDPRLVKKLRDWRAAVNSGADSPHSKSWSHHNLQWEQPACEEEQAPAQETETEPEEPQSAWTGSREELASPSVWDLKRRAWEVGREYPVIDGCLSFLILPGADQPGSGQPNDVYVTSEWPELYEHMGEGFGPVNLGVVHAFCNWMEKKFRQHQKEERHSGETRKIVYYLAENTAHQTNAAFLIASYLLIKMKWTPAQAWAPFGCIKPSPFAKYPAASLDEEASEEGFHLPVLACLQGVAMAIHRGLYLPETFDDNVYSQVGRRDAEDLHYCTPTLAAFSAPSKTSEKVSPWASSKTAADYAPLFAARGIRDVVTLSEDSDDYPEKAFTAHGVRHRSLSFPEYGHPPCEVVEDFVALMRAAPGAVAVHCSDGRGRTGELLGVYLMIHHRCSASEALGWLRVVRPGSVPKGGEDYLFWAEEMLAGGRPLRDPPLANQARRARLEANVRKMRSTVVGERFVARMRSDQVYRTHEREGERLVNFLTGEEEEEELQETGGGLMQPPLDLIAKC